MIITDAKTFGVALRRRRKELNYTQTFVSEVSGFIVSFFCILILFSLEVSAMEKKDNTAYEDKIAAFVPGDIVDKEQVRGQEESYFMRYPIKEGDEVYERINGKSYRENDDIALEELRYLKLLHYNFEHEIQVGELIVNEDVADDVLAIFRELFDAEYEIQSMYLVDNYWTGDATETDTASIEENNSSAFNYREATGGGKLSNHALGRAIDINPQQNPYILYRDGEWHWAHENATPYIDRTSCDPHVICAGDTCYNIFAKYDFDWGGEWENPVDYQHFAREN